MEKRGHSRLLVPLVFNEHSLKMSNRVKAVFRKRENVKKKNVFKLISIEYEEEATWMTVRSIAGNILQNSSSSSPTSCKKDPLLKVGF